ncbi:PhaM family polyhydroxyalkanoate granule multifunctional regulatory protein [Ideonella sp. A 288]|uniref:PhaM family polyhydroxyalkanoate granule multifunctional regulatory protein n=1 Tax=Ideonella sp. A 288 TaxID=1962181 RepID=UPI000B4A6AA9|nr:PhaM family polyhydroxyalkanoate granule multifunctional regulatory protein [Ideonella sp. A 288]
MSDPTDFTKMVPGFDFLQGLVKNAGASLPNVGHWIAPTLDPEEIEKRIEELRTVQFWLEQNARMLGATIQALEVQRMTLTTLKTMNVQLGDLAESLKIRMPEPAPADDEPEAAPPPKAASRYAFSPKAPDPEPEAEAEPQAAAAPQVPPGVPDPMQWWGALTQQFTELAANAMKDSTAEAARNLAGSMVKQGFEAANAASESMKKAASMAMTTPAAKPASRATSRPATSAAASAPAGPKGAAKKAATGTARKKAAAKKPAAPRR